MTGNTKAWIGKFGEIGHPYTHPSTKQCNYYVDLTPYLKKAYLPYGSIIIWYGTQSSIPAGWAICDGSNGTPDLRDRFVVGAGYSYEKGSVGGEAEVVLTELEMPSHNHYYSGSTDTNGGSSSGGSYPVSGHDQGATATKWSGYVCAGDISSRMNGYALTTGGSSPHSHSFSGYTADTGSNSAHNNLPPYYALYFIMKIS